MKLFFQHIETLLARNDYVIVPHFGGFVAQQQSAEIHENTITPPFVAVGFNPLLRHSDGLLEMEIARAQGFAYRDAIENIAANVHKVNNLLAQNQIIDVGKLGEISQSSDKIIFRPAADFSFLPANLGLQNADFHFINAKNNFENKNKKGDKAITVILYPKMMLRYAASIALIFSMLFAQPFLDDKQQQASFLPILKSEKPQFETFKYVPYLADTMKMVQDAESFSNESEKNTVFAKAETNNLNPSNTQLENYHIIVGCFNTEKAAQNYFTHLKIKGIDNIYIIASTKLFRVSVGSFPTINEAKNALKNLKSFNQEFENAWVMQK